MSTSATTPDPAAVPADHAVHQGGQFSLLRQRRSGQARQNTRTQRARHLWACGGWEGSHFLLSAPSAALL